MTQKELLYFEDAINHEQSVLSFLDDMEKNVKDKNIKEFISDEVDHHNNLLNLLINTLKEKTNE